jgi:hypothetical protein
MCEQSFVLVRCFHKATKLMASFTRIALATFVFYPIKLKIPEQQIMTNQRTSQHSILVIVLYSIQIQRAPLPYMFVFCYIVGGV